MSAPTIVVVDYGMGNRRSVQKALEHVGARAQITSDRDAIIEADGLVVPGVGAFPMAMRNLNELGLIELLSARAAAGTPLLGICLGMQVLFERSDELEGASGIGVLGGEVTALRTRGLPVPHIGWNEVAFARDCPLTDGLPSGGCPFYHVHSFAVRPSDPADVVGTAEYGEPFASFVARDNVFGVQFHPEKSSAHGLTLLSDFTRLSARTPAATGA
jgi:glutamine amidotransferase